MISRYSDIHTDIHPHRYSDVYTDFFFVTLRISRYLDV